MCICLQHAKDPVQSISNYYLASKSLPDEDTLGTAIYVHSSITYDKININNPYLQMSAIRLHIYNKNITLCNIYNQPNQNYNLNQLSNVLSNLQQPILLVGDFNAHHPLWDENTENADQAGIQIELLMENDNYCCLNESEIATYFSKTHGTLTSVDLSLCSATIIDNFEWNVADDLYTSDHFPIIISYLNEDPSPQIPRYNFNKANWELYDLHTRAIPPSSPLEDHNKRNETLTSFIINAANKSIPITTGNTHKKTVPWWSEELSDLNNIKHKLRRRIDRLNQRFKKLKPNQNQALPKLVSIALEISSLKPQLNRISAKFRKTVIQARKLSWQNYVSNISNNTTNKHLWDKFRKINGKHIQQPRSPLVENGQRIHDIKQISNILSQHFESIANHNNLDQHFRQKRNNSERNIINFETDEKLYYNTPFAVEELEASLSKCSNSAPGQDNISFDLIKHLNQLAKKRLLEFYNHLWTKGLFPQKWRHAIIIPIAKPGKDPSRADNYRPISLTSCLCKLMEKMVHNRLSWYIEKNEIITPTQNGCRAGRSTLDSLTLLENQIREGFNQRKITIAIFFYIKKAYDTTWRHSILKSLFNNGLRGQLPTFIQNFLSKRTFQTRVNTIYSNTYELKEGIPQGSVLSSTLFAIAINDIVKTLPQGINNSLFVDDFAIFYTSNNPRHLERILQTAINKIQNWASSVGFNFSIDKTKAIAFYRDIRWLKDQDISLTLYNNNINFYNNVKFLGMIFDNHLNWKTHINHTKAKCLKATNILKKLSHTTWGADRNTMTSLYKSTVLSILEYGSPIYSAASKYAIKTLSPIHHLGLRLATGAFKSSPTASIIVDSGDIPLEYRFQITTMRRALKMQMGKSPAK